MKIQTAQTPVVDAKRVTLNAASPVPASSCTPASGGFLTGRLLALCAALSLAAAGDANANDFSNGYLDSIGITDQNRPTPIGWTTIAVKAFSGSFFDGGSSEPWCNVAEPDGYGLFFKPFQGEVEDEISVYFYQDNPATPGTKFTLAGYAAGDINYCGFFTTNSPLPQTLFVIEFLDATSTVLTSNAYDLIAAGLPSGGPSSMALITTPEFTAPAGTFTVRAGVAMNNAYNTHPTAGGQGFFVDALELISVPPPGSPVITNQPSPTTVAVGGNTGFTVGVADPAGVTYQWQRAGTNLFNGGSISGATNATLAITGASTNDVAHYRCLVANSFGSVYSETAPLALFGLSINPIVAISGKIGDTYRVDYSTVAAPDTWIPLSTNTLTMSPQIIIDPGASGFSSNRFYRAVFLD